MLKILKFESKLPFLCEKPHIDALHDQKLSKYSLYPSEMLGCSEATPSLPVEPILTKTAFLACFQQFNGGVERDKLPPLHQHGRQRMEGDFSQRMGFIPLKPEIQLDDMNDDLRTGLWNVLLRYYLNGYAPRTGSVYRLINGSNRQSFATNYYSNFIKCPIDSIPPAWESFLADLRRDFLSHLSWHRIYSLLEFVLREAGNQTKQTLTDALNNALEQEGSGYRVINGIVSAITSPAELETIVDAMTNSTEYLGIGDHLNAAVRMLSDKEKPDYRNSIKESISAVESLAKQITGNAATTLGPALSELEKHHRLHPALKNAFSSLYGWTSNADGIRHALMDVSDLSQADARFMLICCSAFINFTIDSMKE